jgi:RNA polymerase sigma-70 factor (ECF subfamily)
VFATIYRQMRSLVGKTQDFDDLVQSALEQVHRSFPRFEARAQVSTWTFRICYQVWLKHLRWHRRFFARFSLADGARELDAEDPGPAVTEVLERAEKLAGLKRALDRVQPKRRAVLILHDLEGLSVAEIAEIVAANPLTVRSRLRDGRRRLAEELAKDPYFTEIVAEEDDA